MHVVTILNLKGGVGKTSCTYHLAGTLAAQGSRVLMLDNDPQASLTQGFWGPRATRAIDPGETMAALYRGDRPFPEVVIKSSGIAGLDLVPGSKAATDYNAPRPQDAGPELQDCILDFLADLDPTAYDFVLIDCPPNLYLCSWAALRASGFLIVPTQPEDFGAQGLHDVREMTAMVQAGPNPGLVLLGYLLTRVALKKGVHQAYEQTLRDEYGPLVFEARIPDAVAYIVSIAARKPIAQHKPKGNETRAIAQLAAEIRSRIESTTFAHREEAA